MRTACPFFDVVMCYLENEKSIPEAVAGFFGYERNIDIFLKECIEKYLDNTPFSEMTDLESKYCNRNLIS